MAKRKIVENQQLDSLPENLKWRRDVIEGIMAEIDIERAPEHYTEERLDTWLMMEARRILWARRQELCDRLMFARMECPKVSFYGRMDSLSNIRTKRRPKA